MAETMMQEQEGRDRVGSGESLAFPRAMPSVIVAEVADATRTYVDDEGWATPQPSNIITAVA